MDKIIPPGQNFNSASPTIIREQLEKLVIQYSVREAIVLVAKNIKRDNPKSETFAQAVVGASTMGEWAVKSMVTGLFEYHMKQVARLKGIKAAKAKKLLKLWSTQ